MLGELGCSAAGGTGISLIFLDFLLQKTGKKDPSRAPTCGHGYPLHSHSRPRSRCLQPSPGDTLLSPQEMSRVSQGLFVSPAEGRAPTRRRAAPQHPAPLPATGQPSLARTPLKRGFILQTRLMFLLQAFNSRTWNGLTQQVFPPLGMRFHQCFFKPFP